MDPSRDSRYNLNYSMSSIGLSLADNTDLYGNPGVLTGAGRPPSGGLIQSMGRPGSGGLMGHGGGGGSGSGGGQCQNLVGGQSRGIKRTSSDCYEDHHRSGGGGGGGQMTTQTLQGLESCGGGGGGNGGGGGGGGGNNQQQTNVPDVVDDGYTSLQNKKSPPANGKKTKGRVKIKMEYIDNKLRRYTTFSKRKTGIMKKAYELSTLTGTQVMLLVASETGHVYTFATRKLQPMITSEAGKQLIQTCLNSPDPPSGAQGGDQRMSATGFEETELSYNIADEDSKDDRSPVSSVNESDESSDIDSPGPASMNNSQPVLADFKMEQQQQQQHGQNSHHQSQNQPSTSTSYDAGKTPAFAHMGGMNNVISGRTLYPASALANLPEDYILGLVQSGQLQMHTEEETGHQYITIPISMTNPSNSTFPAPNTAPSGSNSNSRTVSQHQTSGNDCKIQVKDLTFKGRSSGSTLSNSSRHGIQNGRESPPKEVTRIKEEVNDE